MVHLLMSPDQGLFSKLRCQSKGQHESLRWCDSWDSSPARWVARRGCNTHLFWRFLLMKSRHTRPWNGRHLCSVAAAIFIIGGKWCVEWKPMTPSIDSDGRPLIGPPTTFSKWPPFWRLRTCVEIRMRQGELSRGHLLDRFYVSKWPNL